MSRFEASMVNDVSIFSIKWNDIFMKWQVLKLVLCLSSLMHFMLYYISDQFCDYCIVGRSVFSAVLSRWVQNSRASYQCMKLPTGGGPFLSTSYKNIRQWFQDAICCCQIRCELLQTCICCRTNKINKK